MDVTLLHWRGIFMAKKGTTFNTYSNEIKLSAVQSYLNGEGNYDMIAEKYQIRSSTQLKNWVKKYKGIFMSCVFRHFSQYKYNTIIPKQPAHLLPKSGHNSATIKFLRTPLM
ncbi:hypothetical protein COM77_30340 [Bacillus cereus]|nr:hypothetical protein COM77_30340 [Bacillus cereus]PEE91070.1 hypothetical protein COM92_30520 [Bacillus cereus]PER98678.1 hypothetical protein CN500_05980 [Bacillus cereus]PGN68753.1 hypothetical protein CN967_30560 [Bacillus cereus]